MLGGDQRGDRPRGDADRDNYRRDGGDKGGAGSDFKPEFVSFELFGVLYTLCLVLFNLFGILHNNSQLQVQRCSLHRRVSYALFL